MERSLKFWVKNLFVGRDCDHDFCYSNYEYVQCQRCGKLKKDPALAERLFSEKWLDSIEAEVFGRTPLA